MLQGIAYLGESVLALCLKLIGVLSFPRAGTFDPLMIFSITSTLSRSVAADSETAALIRQVNRVTGLVLVSVTQQILLHFLEEASLSHQSSFSPV